MTEEASTAQTTAEDVMDRLAEYAHWALRIALASVFLYHGIGKLVGLEQTAEMLGLPFIIALLVALAEAGGGALVIVGAFTRDWITRIGAAFIIPVMLGAVFMVHWPQWSFVASESHPMGGMEFQVTLLLVALYLVIKGNRA